MSAMRMTGLDAISSVNTAPAGMGDIPPTTPDLPPASSDTMVILHNPDRCTGCRQCMTACSFKNFNTYNYDLSLCRVIRGPDNGFVRIHCHHCTDPMCLAACPVSAISKDPGTGIVTIDKMRCIGCRACTWACPISVPQMQRGLKAMTKCDLCKGDPSCIKVCSARAIQLVPRAEARNLNKVLE